MTALVVRRLKVDLKPPIARRWNGGDAFRTAFFNALSMSFPVGEQYFIDSVRAGLKALPVAERPRWAEQIQAFVGQEATHRHLHALFNGHLEAQGFDNAIERRALRRMLAHAGMGVRNHVAATAATEHFTALFAHWLLQHPRALSGAEPRLQMLWQWHAAEESEHRDTAFDLYQALGGDNRHRNRIFYQVSVVFLWDLGCQTVNNLWHDGSLFKVSTWRSGWALLWSRHGLFRSTLAGWRDYTRPDFHPSQHEAPLAAQWLQDHTSGYSVVGASGPAPQVPA